MSAIEVAELRALVTENFSHLIRKCTRWIEQLALGSCPEAIEIESARSDLKTLGTAVDRIFARSEGARAGSGPI